MQTVLHSFAESSSAKGIERGFPSVSSRYSRDNSHDFPMQCNAVQCSAMQCTQHTQKTTSECLDGRQPHMMGHCQIMSQVHSEMYTRVRKGDCIGFYVFMIQVLIQVQPGRVADD